MYLPSLIGTIKRTVKRKKQATKQYREYISKYLKRSYLGVGLQVNFICFFLFIYIYIYIYILLFSHQFVSNSLWSHELQDIRLPCSPLPSEVCSGSCPLTWWYYPTISSSAALFFCLQFFPAPGSFPISLLFTSGSQSTETSALASLLPMNIRVWFPLGLTGLISLQSTGLSKVFSTVWKHRLFNA